MTSIGVRPRPDSAGLTGDEALDVSRIGRIAAASELRLVLRWRSVVLPGRSVGGPDVPPVTDSRPRRVAVAAVPSVPPAAAAPDPPALALLAVALLARVPALPGASKEANRGGAPLPDAGVVGIVASRSNEKPDPFPFRVLSGRFSVNRELPGDGSPAAP